MCAMVALVIACLGSGGDPQGPRFAGDEGDGIAAFPSLSESLPAVAFEPPVVPPKRGSVFIDNHPPHAFLTTSEVFRPPRAV